ncbi:hypothetical protein BSL78_28811 [Apostichopus japonicus]|uniref:CCHC-type domain-containing protein n=1 Tax=Stichopus japonicus TaxID=307972 RepID=A0A2G8JF55_STIJA|nr:hypothetical protein BSL78_28811 [Apostichopus japonicus]
MRLAEVTRERELVERTKLLQERQALEKKLKLLEIELQHQAESHEIERKLAESRGRSQVLEEIEENSQCLESDEDLEDGIITSKQNNKVFTKEWDARPRKTEVRRPEQHEGKELGKVLIEMQKPKLEIKKFSGDCLTFNKFMRQFRSRIEGLCSNDEKMAYLEQYTVEEAHKIVVGFSYLDAAVGYPAAIKELQRRYGDPEIIANTYVKRVLNWPSIRADDPKALDELAVFLKECEAATRCVGGLGVLEFSENLKHILQKLPFYMHDRWRSIVQGLRKKGNRIGFSNLVDFIQAESIKLNDPVYGRSSLVSDKGRKLDHGRAKIAAVTNVENKPVNCWNCDEPHLFANCPKFKAMTMNERRDKVRNLKVCFKCLRRGHMSTGCRTTGAGCDVCKGNHHTLLHNFADAAQQPASITHSQVVLWLRIRQFVPMLQVPVVAPCLSSQLRWPRVPGTLNVMHS